VPLNVACSMSSISPSLYVAVVDVFCIMF
jgi:hypothetical protein